MRFAAPGLSTGVALVCVTQKRNCVSYQWRRGGSLSPLAVPHRDPQPPPAETNSHHACITGRRLSSRSSRAWGGHGPQALDARWRYGSIRIVLFQLFAWGLTAGQSHSPAPSGNCVPTTPEAPLADFRPLAARSGNNATLGTTEAQRIPAACVPHGSSGAFSPHGCRRAGRLCDASGCRARRAPRTLIRLPWWRTRAPRRDGDT